MKKISDKDIQDVREIVKKIHMSNQMKKNIIHSCVNIQEKKKTKCIEFRWGVIMVALLLCIFVGGFPTIHRSASTGKLIVDHGLTIVEAGYVTEDNTISFKNLVVGDGVVVEDIFDKEYSIAISSLRGIPLKFSYAGADIEFKSYTGGFSDLENEDCMLLGRRYSIMNKGEVFWVPDIIISSKKLKSESDIVEFQVIKDNNVIEYGIIYIECNDKKNTYKSNLLLSISFPKVDGEYQRVTEENLKEIREKTLKNHSINTDILYE